MTRTETSLPPAFRCALLELEKLAPLFGAGLEVSSVPDAAPVADGTTKAVVRNRKGVPVAFATCSSPVRADLVSLSLRNAASVRRILGARLGAPVIVPLAEGCLEGLSYAIFNYHEPFPSHGLRWRLLRSRLGRSVLGWLVDVADASRLTSGGVEARDSFRGALEVTQAHALLPTGMRGAAQQALRRLESGEWRPSHVIDHNDCWIGNLLHGEPAESGRPSEFPFVLIDWAGANVQGFGVYDCVRAAQSARVGPKLLGRSLESYAAASACAPGDLAGHFLACIGHLAANLGFYPAERFAADAHECWDILEAAMRVLA